MGFPAFPIFDGRRADEDPAGFGLRLLAFVIAHDFVPALEADTLDTGAHAALYAYGRETTPGTAEAINRAVTMMRASAARRRSDVRASLLALGFTDEPISKPEAGQPAGSIEHGGQFTAEEVAILKAAVLDLRAGQSGNDDDNGHKVRVRKPKPVNPPAGCAAPF